MHICHSSTKGLIISPLQNYNIFMTIQLSFIITPGSNPSFRLLLRSAMYGKNMIMNPQCVLKYSSGFPLFAG